MEEADAGQDGEAAAAPPVASLDLSNVRGFQALPGAGDAPADALDEETRQRELAKEFSARAARFAEAVDDAIVLANDGAIRWLGDPVAKIVAGEETLKPRAVILADDALPAEGRQAAEHRVELWLSAHVRKTLGPLLTLLEPESVPEAVRDIALKLSQSLGILERERVKSQVKALDQNARGALRKLGVRFGAHYLYVPALLKPAARALCAQLWALSRGEADKEAVAEKLLHFASSGRTSFAVEGPASGEVYRVAGFRLCGERAVRVDIVERLTDLIRAALPRHLTANPAAEGEASPIGFVVTNQMTSLTGCSGEHFASILRSLGFASHQVKKSAYLAALKAAQPAPVEPVVAPAAEVTTAEAPVAGEGEQAASDAPSPHDETSVVEPTGEVSDAPALEVAEPEPAEARRRRRLSLRRSRLPTRRNLRLQPTRKSPRSLKSRRQASMQRRRMTRSRRLPLLRPRPALSLPPIPLLRRLRRLSRRRPAKRTSSSKFGGRRRAVRALSARTIAVRRIVTGRAHRPRGLRRIVSRASLGAIVRVLRANNPARRALALEKRRRKTGKRVLPPNRAAKAAGSRGGATAPKGHAPMRIGMRRRAPTRRNRVSIPNPASRASISIRPLRSCSTSNRF